MSNETDTLTLSDFLVERIAEKEGWARTLRHDGLERCCKHGFDPVAHVLADCNAKRRIVVLHRGACSSDYLPCSTLRLLAMPYADHPDFRDEWNP